MNSNDRARVERAWRAHAEGFCPDQSALAWSERLLFAALDRLRGDGEVSDREIDVLLADLADDHTLDGPTFQYLIGSVLHVVAVETEDDGDLATVVSLADRRMYAAKARRRARRA